MLHLFTRARSSALPLALAAALLPASLALAQGDELPGLRRPRPAPTTPALPAGDPASAPTSDPAPSSAQPAAATSRLGNNWTIVLATFRGPERLAQAAAALDAAKAAGLTDVTIDPRGEAVILCAGRYPDPSADAALARVKQIGELRVAGARPYLGAFLAPPGGLTRAGARPQYNLGNARDARPNQAQSSKTAPRYTLQVAVYGREELARDPTEAELAESRVAAEEGVLRLRQEGEEAFYYHGPRRSMVTIGLFGEDDLARASSPGLSGQAGAARDENPALSALRKRFPNNLYNGAGVREKPRQGPARLQSSVLVLVPEK